jgi:serine/threonine protein kinase
LDFQHCVKMLGWIEHDKHPAMILEYLDGVSLFEMMKLSPLSKVLIEEVVAQIQAGLLDLQRHNLRHGDLSPKNIFITQTGLVKLLDFGFSGQKSLQACTFPYLALEGWEGKALSWESDLYSLGLLMREIETDTRPLDRDQARQRAEAWKDSNSLLSKDPQQRQFLALQSQLNRRELLAEKVQWIQQNQQKSSLQQTVLINAPLRRKTHLTLSLMRTPFLFLMLLCPILFYSQRLHPADQYSFAKTSRVWTLEVRSLRWAQVTLYHLRHRKTVLIRQQYTPFLQTHLSPGHYQLRWQSHRRSGLISVQLNKNQRILLP